MRPHPLAWLPKASTSGFPAQLEAIRGQGSTFLSATNVTFQESSTSSPLESLCFLLETRFFPRHCQQAKESRILPLICSRNLFGENKEGSGQKGPSLRAGARPGVQAGRPARLCLLQSSGTRQASRSSGDRDLPSTREMPVPRQGLARVPESSASNGNPPRGYWALGGWFGTEFCFLSC